MASELISEYLKFTGIRNSCKNRIVNLSSHSWMHPTALLPLINYVIAEGASIEPPDSSLATYISYIMKRQEDFCVDGKTYVPFTSLPKDPEKSKVVLEQIFSLPEIGKDCGGQQAFKYVLSELVDNIDQHSECSSANVIAQKYSRLGFVDIAIFDDGISIPGRFEKSGIVSDDCDAVIDAINGLSTKDKERGYGLSSCVKIFTQGMMGEILLVSRRGAILLERSGVTAFKLNDNNILKGTLVNVRVPISPKIVDIYAYVQ